MVDEAADVAVESGIDAVGLPFLIVESEEERVVLSFVSLSITDDLPNVLANK